MYIFLLFVDYGVLYNFFFECNQCYFAKPMLFRPLKIFTSVIIFINIQYLYITFCAFLHSRISQNTRLSIILYLSSLDRTSLNRQTAHEF